MPTGNAIQRAVKREAGKGEGGRALYHCRGCFKDISSEVRIRCAECRDLDLCVHCFSVGVEPHPHKKHHAYKVVDNLSFPLLDPEWAADEEILLLDAIAAHGLSNWAEIAEHVGPKTKEQCKAHYLQVYIDVPTAPLPDPSTLLLDSKASVTPSKAPPAGAKPPGASQGPDQSAEVFVFDKNQTTPRKAGDLAAMPGGGVQAMTPTRPGAQAQGMNTGCVPDPPSSGPLPRARGPRDRTGPVLTERTDAARRFNANRGDFDVELDGEAELPLAEMEIRHGDSEREKAAKRQMLQIYHRRLQERERRKQFILARGLLQVKEQQEREKHFSHEAKQLRAQVSELPRPDPPCAPPAAGQAPVC